MKKLLALFLCSIVYQAHAETSHIVSSETKCSPGVKCGVLHESFETYPIDKKKAFKNYGFTTTIVHGRNGGVRENLMFTSSHNYEVCNTERTNGYFSMHYELEDNMGHHIGRSDHALVMANTCASGHVSLFLVNSYAFAGTYTLTGSTDVDGTNRSYDTDTITIN